MRQAPLGEIATINPRAPAELRSKLRTPVSFVSMSGLSVEGRIVSKEARPLGDVMKGFTYFEKGDILLAKITPCMENGKAALVEGLPHEIGFGSTEFHVLRPGPKLLPKYLFHCVWNKHFRKVAASKMTGAAGQKRVPTPFLQAFKIPLPTLSEQRRIAAILDKADAIRRKRQEQFREAEGLLSSIFIDIFGDPVRNPKRWPESKLEMIAEIRSGVTKGRNLRGKKVVSVPYMRVANVQDGVIRTDDVSQIEVLPSDIDALRLRVGDILLTEGGDPDKLGRGAVWQGQIDPCIHQNHVFRVRSNKSIACSQFLSAQIGSQRGKRYFFRAAKQTTGIASINMTQLKQYPALLPPIDLQRRFATATVRHVRLMDMLRCTTSKQEDLFGSLAAKFLANGE